MKKNSNQGFSLIELVVVIAIMAVALGIGSFSLGIIQSTRSKTCANAIQNALTTHRTTAMAKGDTEATVHIYRDTSTNHIMVQKGSAAAEDIGGAGVTVTYHFKGDAEDTYQTLGSETKELKVNFTSTSGSIRDSDAIDWIRLSGNKNYKINIYKLTGKAELVSE